MDNPLYWELYGYGYNSVMQPFMDSLQEASMLNYKLINNTGCNIKAVYISKSNSGDWGNNLLDSLWKSGTSVSAESPDEGPYDIIVVDTNGNQYSKLTRNISDGLEINFTSNDKDIVANKVINGRVKDLNSLIVGNNKGGYSENSKGQVYSTQFKADYYVSTNDGSNLRLRSAQGTSANQIGSLLYIAAQKSHESGQGEPAVRLKRAGSTVNDKGCKIVLR
jgi:hypothetical protein